MIHTMDSVNDLSDELWQRRIVLPDYVYERETNQSVWLLRELGIAECLAGDSMDASDLKKNGSKQLMVLPMLPRDG